MLIRTPEDAAELLQPLFASCPDEIVAVLHLGRDRRLLAMTIEEPGTVDAVELPVRAILAATLRLGGIGLVVAHNHPSGDPAPSEADRSATAALARIAAPLGIELHDHLIFAGSEWQSFRMLKLL